MCRLISYRIEPQGGGWLLVWGFFLCRPPSALDQFQNCPRATTLYAWKTRIESSDGDPPGGKAAPYSIKSPKVNPLGQIIFPRSAMIHLSGHFLSMHSRMNAAWLIAFSTAATFAGLGRSESSSISFLAHNNAEANRIAHFRSSVDVTRQRVFGIGCQSAVKEPCMKQPCGSRPECASR